MIEHVAGMLGLALAVFFYTLTAYHLFLIVLGLRLTRGLPGSFDRGSLRNPVDLPKVSILVPAKDEEPVIAGAIRCADALQYPRELLEIIVVEDGSTDETPGIAKRMETEVRSLIALTGGPTKGKPAALNRALRVASGDVIAVFDSDTRYDSDLLLRIAKFFHDHPDIPIVQAYPKVQSSETNLLTKLNAIEMHAWFRGMQAAKSRMKLFVHLGGTGMFIRRELFARLGSWDENALTEDLDFSLRVSREGIPVGMLAAPVRIQPTYRIRDFLQQRRRWWGGALQVARKAMSRTKRTDRKLRARLDAAFYLSSPLLFLLGSIALYGSLLYFVLKADITTAMAAWLTGLLGSSLLLAPLVVYQAIRLRKPQNLFLLPGLYVYWFLQLIAFIWAVGTLALRSRIPWVRTPKRNLD